MSDEKNTFDENGKSQDLQTTPTEKMTGDIRLLKNVELSNLTEEQKKLLNENVKAMINSTLSDVKNMTFETMKTYQDLLKHLQAMGVELAQDGLNKLNEITGGKAEAPLTVSEGENVIMQADEERPRDLYISEDEELTEEEEALLEEQEAEEMEQIALQEQLEKEQRRQMLINAMQKNAHHHHHRHGAKHGFMPDRRENDALNKTHLKDILRENSNFGHGADAENKQDDTKLNKNMVAAILDKKSRR